MRSVFGSPFSVSFSALNGHNSTQTPQYEHLFSSKTISGTSISLNPTAPTGPFSIASSGHTSLQMPQPVHRSMSRARLRACTSVFCSMIDFRPSVLLEYIGNKAKAHSLLFIPVQLAGCNLVDKPEGKRHTLRRHPRLRLWICRPALCTSSLPSQVHQRRVQAR